MPDEKILDNSSLYLLYIDFKQFAIHFACFFLAADIMNRSFYDSIFLKKKVFSCTQI